MLARSKAFAILIALYAPVAQAQDAATARPYSFSGTCSSQGLWTQEALQTTQTIRNFTLQLKNDPSCQALGQHTQAAIQKLEQMVRPPIAANYSARLAELPQEISAFRNFLSSGDSSLKESVKKTMMSKTIEMATLRSSISAKTGGMGMEVGAALGEAVGGPVGGVVGAIAAGSASTIGGQFNYSTQQGLLVFNDVIDSLPQMQTCLTGGDQAAGQMVAASVKLLTAFAASGQDSTGTGLATAISKLTTAMRDMHFAKTLRTLNQADFLASMSCLVEMTSENYCTTRDSKMLFDEMMKEIQVRPRDQELQRVGAQSPLAGYYILTQNLPMITNWIQRVQTGVEPRLPTDANFQNKIFDEVNNFFKKVKDIEGTFSMDVQAMKVIPDERGRKNAARNIVMKLSNIVSGGGFGETELKNFFDLKGSSREIPFFLMGVDIPDAVKGVGTAQQDPNNFLEVNYMNYAPFQDPTALMELVRGNLNDLVKVAQTNAIQYYNQWFIVDKISLVNESLLGTNYSVKQSLIMTNNYLGQVEVRMRANNTDASMIGALQDTRSKIHRVLLAYDNLEKVSKQLTQQGQSLSPDDEKTIENANLQIISSVYDEFQVLLGKSGWFQNRIVKFVYADYLMQLKSNEGYGSALDDLYYATGLSIFDQIVMTAGGNPAKVQNDLSLALRLNKMNLEAVENLIRDDFAGTTADLRGVVKIGLTPGAVNGDVHTNLSTGVRAYQDSLVEIPGENSWHITRVVKGLWAATREEVKNATSVIPWIGGAANPKYVASNERYAMDDEFGSSKRLYEQFCIQSLAFGDLRSFYKICRNSTLKSPFEASFLASLPPDQIAALSTSYDKKLVESRENPQLNFSKRICAFRDYNRKNLVVYLTNAQKAK